MSEEEPNENSPSGRIPYSTAVLVGRRAGAETLTLDFAAVVVCSLQEHVGVRR